MELEPEGVVPPANEEATGSDSVLSGVEDLLDEQQFEAALDEIAKLRAKGVGNAIDLAFLAGDAWIGLGQGRAAEVEFRKVLERDPDCPTTRSSLAMCLYLQWRFDEAKVAAAAARELPDAVPDAHSVYGLVLEREGNFDEADACFELAAAGAPDRYSVPVRMTKDEFDRVVRKSARKLPRQFRKAMDRVPVVVMDLPEHFGGDDQGFEIAPDVLGLFVGVALPDTEEADLNQPVPNTIYLFQRNLERVARSRDDLHEQIEITLYHELAHYLGFEEEDMEGLGLD
ncbi:MAG: hypothetical protein RL398_2837 [Planctomycetota bacterium]|jgi:predicted Zn-dependent protease with MMP-like domain